MAAAPLVPQVFPHLTQTLRLHDMCAKSTDTSCTTTEDALPAYAGEAREDRALRQFVEQKGYVDFDKFWELVNELPGPSSTPEQTRAWEVLKEFSALRMGRVEMVAAAWSEGLLGPKPPRLTQEQKMKLLERAARWVRNSKPNTEA